MVGILQYKKILLRCARGGVVAGGKRMGATHPVGLRRRFMPARKFRLAVVVASLLAILLLLFVRARARELNHAEEQFLAPPALLLQSDLLPYRDYPCFHTPNL